MGDPVKVMERREEGTHAPTCSGCVHLKKVKSQFWGREVLTCAKDFPIGQRCDEYVEK